MKVPKHILLFLLAALAAVSCSSGKLLCRAVLNPPRPVYYNIKDARKMEDGRFPGLMAWYDSLKQENVFRDTFIVNNTGTALHAVFAESQEKKGAAVILHGYGVNHIAMLHLARVYRDSLGFSVLLPDLQYHGLSGGNSVRMGWDDRLDVRQWVDVAHSFAGGDFILVHGVSMGGATTMMLSGEPDLPEYLRGFISDCGYTSVWDEFCYLETHSPFTMKSLENANKYCKQTYGWDFHEASSVLQLKKSEKPVFFIHGDGDTFVPPNFATECYDAKQNGYKELWVVKDAPKHAQAYHSNPAEYLAHLRSFISRLVSGCQVNE